MAPGTDAGCTYTVAPGEAEGQPVTCVSADFADAYCAKLGKRLPTEAEWEWAAGNLGRQTPHPWVDVASPCARAVVATTTGCNDGNGTPGPRAGGDARDVTALGVVNLGGNVSEWLADTLAPYAEGPCWGASVGLKVSPRCSSGAVRSIRGGSWFAEAFAARVTNRNGAPPAFRGPDLGFRCAR